MPLLLRKIMWGIYAPSIYARKFELKLVNILNLQKKMIVWQKSSVGWSIIQGFECSQLKPLRALYWDLTSAWSSFYFEVWIAIRQQWLTLDDWVCRLNNSPKDSHAAKQQLKKRMKRGNSDVLLLQYKVIVLFLFLAWCQSSEH